jgi:hypothetical protein
MSNEEFEAYLALVSRLLRLSPGQREKIGEELRDHLESRVAELTESGVERQSALIQAVEEFGDASVLAENLKAVSKVSRKRWMMRFMTMCTAVLFFMAVLTMALWPEDSRFGAPSNIVAQEDVNEETINQEEVDLLEAGFVAPKPAVGVKLSDTTRATNDIKVALAQRMDLMFDESPFGDVKTVLEEELSINFVLDSSAIDDSLEYDTPISVSLRDIPVSEGLRLLLKPYNATYFISGNVIQIISNDDADSPEYFRRKMIRVGNLLDLIKRLEADRIGTPRYVNQIGGGGGGGGGGGVFCIQGLGGGGLVGSSDVEPAAQTIVGPHPSATNPLTGAPVNVPLVTAESLLIDAIQTTVSADDWQATGQGEAALTCVGGILILHANESLVAEVENFVTDLEFELQSQTDR